MAKQKIKDIKKELQEEQDEFYGDTTVSGSAPEPGVDDDTDTMVEEVTGEKPEEFEPVSIADEVEEAEKFRHTKPKIDIGND